MTKRDVVARILEYFIALLFIRGGLEVLFFSEDGPKYLPGIFTYLVGQYAVIVYGTCFLVAGLGLLLSNIFNKKKVRKWILFGMVLTCSYILPLALIVNGLEWNQIQVVVAGLISAWLWLRLKLQTEYIDTEQFRKELYN